jgi:metallo-beta-lactamase class B
MEKKPGTLMFFWQITYSHTIAYFLAGIFALVFMNYRELFAGEAISAVMRPVDDPVVALGAGLQIFRGIIIALIILPLRKVFFEEKHGLLKLGLIIFGFSYLATIGPGFGSFEGYIFTKIPFKYQLIGYPEAILYVAMFIGILKVSMVYGHKKIINVLPIILVCLICLMSLMGYLAATGVINTDGPGETKNSNEVYKSDILSVIKISDHVYKHISYLEWGNFGKVPCNGMIVIDNGEAVIFDTPIDDESSAELIDWVAKSLKSKIIAVIPTHYHADNLGGLNEFHKRGIPSYAYNKTIEITKENNGLPHPQHGFDEHLELKVGDKKVWVGFFGGGHTIDNTVGYFPHEDIMFGGCLIKETGSGKGNIAEADVEGWSKTVAGVKAKFPNVKKIMTGHGEIGGPEYLDYTIKLFE